MGGRNQTGSGLRKVGANRDAVVELKEVKRDALLSSGLRALDKKLADSLREREFVQWKLACGTWLEGVRKGFRAFSSPNG
jgi:hypothetical protein